MAELSTFANLDLKYVAGTIEGVDKISKKLSEFDGKELTDADRQWQVALHRFPKNYRLAEWMAELLIQKNCTEEGLEPEQEAKLAELHSLPQLEN